MTDSSSSRTIVHVARTRGARSCFWPSCLGILLALLFAVEPARPVAAESAPTQGDLYAASQTLPLPLRDIQQVTVGSAHTCALTTGGGVKCWGRNDFGQLGDNNAPNHSLVPVDVAGLESGMAAVQAGGSHTCALTTSGGLKCWGDNSNGQLGNDDAPTPSHIPVDVAGLESGMAAVQAGRLHTCALTTGGGVKCWGRNDFGQLGDNNAPNNSDVPVDVETLQTGVATIATGGNHTCALISDGGLKCWGSDSQGQLGDNSILANHDVPRDVADLQTGMAGITAGSSHTCAFTGGGTVKCWGYNGNGQLGNGNAGTDQPTQDNVGGIAKGAIGVATGSTSACALLDNGTIRCWGSNHFGQLGDGTTADRDYPGYVLAPTTCYELTRAKTGSGALPVADPTRTEGCPANHYLPGQMITLAANAASGFRVNGWDGTTENVLISSVNYLQMPAADHSVRAIYAQCHALTRQHTGAGGDPIAAPDRSHNCAENTYVNGETIALIAKPDPNQRVQAWSNADTNPFTGALVNSLVMPDAAHTVSVVYEACFALSATMVGQGEPLIAEPASSSGCAAGRYVAGQSLALTAEPADDWTIQGWNGTAEDNSTNATNQLTMPAADHSVGVTYAEQSNQGHEAMLFMPVVVR